MTLSAILSPIKSDLLAVNEVIRSSLHSEVPLVNQVAGHIIQGGLRVASDFEYEFQLAGMNNKLNKNLETVFLMAEIENQIISSNFVKEIAALKGDLVQFVPNIVIKALKTKFK